MPRPNNTPLTEAQSRLAAQWYPGTLSAAGKIARTRPKLYEDIQDQCTHTLIAAVRAYCPDRGVKFTTYLHRSLESRKVYHMIFRRVDRFPMSNHGGEVTQATSRRERDDPGLSIVEEEAFGVAYDDVMGRVGMLSPFLREVFLRRYRDGQTLQTISEAMGCSIDWASRMSRKAMAEIRARGPIAC